jgi:hypothetical protein
MSRMILQIKVNDELEALPDSFGKIRCFSSLVV